ncbi:Hypothetical predicted protein [Pelobates cultripes]|uniref:HeH/LEM domain-containing protein n=1 Tax=Pelobates cultripes TaxID=61616 RepID=A0AAD1R0J2_PELCU|nr:Hypothetical predicted protein [Pelobates cultripes]
MSHSFDIGEEVSPSSTPARPPTPTTAPTTAENLDSPCSLRSWTIPKIAAELRRRGVPYPAMARKAELYRIMMTTTETPQPGTSSHKNMNETIAGLQATMTSILASISDISQRMDRLEAPEPIIVAPDISLTPDIEHIAA